MMDFVQSPSNCARELGVDVDVAVCRGRWWEEVEVVDSIEDGNDD